MESNAMCHERRVWARTAGRVWTAFAVVALTAIVGGAALAQQVTSPTGATLPKDLPVLVQWGPAGWASSTVGISLYGNQGAPADFAVAGSVSNMPLGVLAASFPNQGQAYVSIPASLACDPTWFYEIAVWADVTQPVVGRAYTFSQNFRLSCVGGSLTVVKTAIDAAGAPLTTGAFVVGVACTPSGPNTTVTLNSADNFQSSLTHIPLGSHCTLTEAAPHAAVGCHWTTTYPQGQEVVTGNAAYRREVRNQLTCLGLKTEATGLATKVAVAAAIESLTIAKKIINNTTTPTPTAPIQMQVACSPGGTTEIVSLSNPNGLTRTVGVAAGSSCTITEVPPVAPPRCWWNTTYRSGQLATIGGVLVVQNELRCSTQDPGTLTVSEFVTDLRPNEPASGPVGGFVVAVSCNNGVTQTLHLNRGASQTVSGLSAGTSCTVTETAPSPPKFNSPLSCPSLSQGRGGTGGAISLIPKFAIWNAAVYSPAQMVTVVSGANAVKITNSFHCGD